MHDDGCWFTEVLAGVMPDTGPRGALGTEGVNGLRGSDYVTRTGALPSVAAIVLRAPSTRIQGKFYDCEIRNCNFVRQHDDTFICDNAMDKTLFTYHSAFWTFTGTDLICNEVLVVKGEVICLGEHDAGWRKIAKRYGYILCVTPKIFWNTDLFCIPKPICNIVLDFVGKLEVRERFGIGRSGTELLSPTNLLLDSRVGNVSLASHIEQALHAWFAPKVHMLEFDKDTGELVTLQLASFEYTFFSIADLNVSFYEHVFITGMDGPCTCHSHADFTKEGVFRMKVTLIFSGKQDVYRCELTKSSEYGKTYVWPSAWLKLKDNGEPCKIGAIRLGAGPEMIALGRLWRRVSSSAFSEWQDESTW